MASLDELQGKARCVDDGAQGGRQGGSPSHLDPSLAGEARQGIGFTRPSTMQRVLDFAKTHVCAKPLKRIGTLPRDGVLHDAWNVPPFYKKRVQDEIKGWGWSENWGTRMGWVYMDLQTMKERKWFHWPDPVTKGPIDTIPFQF
jgi:hypothetical protein